MYYDYTHKKNLAKKTVVTAEFLLDEKDIDFMLKYDMKKKDRIFVNGVFYTLYRKPDIPLFPKEQTLIKLELERCDE